jgi:transcriptional regulator with XRE-family HTH domain
MQMCAESVQLRKLVLRCRFQGGYPPAVSIDLSAFARRQLAAQGLSVKEFARRADLGLSHAYQLIRGERPRPSAETFDAIARGLNMTPAEMAVAMGKGVVDLAPDEVEMLAIYRQVPPEEKPIIKRQLRGLAIPPTTPNRTKRSASQKRSTTLEEHNGEQTRSVPSHLAIANRIFRGSRQGGFRAKRVALPAA